MTRFSFLASVSLAVLLAAPAFAAENPAACPTATFRVLRSNGPATEHGGIYPGIADLCFQKRGTDSNYYYYGIWRADWPGAGEAYPAIKTAMNGPKGTRTDFVTRSLPGWQWVDSFINEGIEPMTVGGRTYRVLRIAHERKASRATPITPSSRRGAMWPPASRSRRSSSRISGQSYGPDTTWQAVGVERLP